MGVWMRTLPLNSNRFECSYTHSPIQIAEFNADSDTELSPNNSSVLNKNSWICSVTNRSWYQECKARFQPLKSNSTVFSSLKKRILNITHGSRRICKKLQFPHHKQSKTMINKWFSFSLCSLSLFLSLLLLSKINNYYILWNKFAKPSILIHSNFNPSTVKEK